jgi:hypothetical protein
MSACLPVRMKQLDSQTTNFNGILYLSIFRKSLEKIQDSLKSDKNNGYFTWRPTYTYDNISLSLFYSKDFFREKFVKKLNKHIW